MKTYSIIVTLFLIASLISNWFFAVNTSYATLFHKDKSAADTNMISAKRISHSNMGVYYCEYNGQQFIITSTGGIIQLRDEKKAK